MSINVTCPDCERRIALDDYPAGGKVACPSCRAVLYVPEPATAEQADNTYALPEVKYCPKCRMDTTPEAKICVNCGYDFRTGKQIGRPVRSEPMVRSWIFGLIPLYFTMVKVEQTSKGKQRVSTTPHLVGIPLGRTEIDLSRCDEVWTDYRQGFGPFGWTIMGLLCLCGLFPGLIWWGLAFYKPTCLLRLPYRNSSVTLYEGWNQITMRNILDTLCELKQLEIVRK
jgi:hypothetical protein